MLALIDMKKLIAAFTLLCSTSFVHGDADPALKKFFHVPNSLAEFGIYPDLQKEEIRDDSVKKELLLQLGEYTLSSDSIWGYRIDLNGDEQMEYFISSKLGGTGGPHYFILQRKNEKWTIIGDIQGWFHTTRSKNEWLDLIVFSRGGGGHYSRSHMQYKQEEYRTIEIQHFDNGKVTFKDTLNSEPQNDHIQSR